MGREERGVAESHNGAALVATSRFHDPSRQLAGVESVNDMLERDVTSPLASVLVDNPATNPHYTSMNPSLANPVAAGAGAWRARRRCSAIQSGETVQTSCDFVVTGSSRTLHRIQIPSSGMPPRGNGVFEDPSFCFKIKSVQAWWSSILVLVLMQQPESRDGSAKLMRIICFGLCLVQRKV
uniref:Uncharacterized protein n=1 Tax=Oryza barthii TaxID=65489 RepID=A0A0D3GBA1_9ORYZ